MIPFKTFNFCTHFKVPLLYSPQKEQTLQMLSTKVSTGLLIQQTLIKAQMCEALGSQRGDRFVPASRIS